LEEIDEQSSQEYSLHKEILLQIPPKWNRWKYLWNWEWYPDASVPQKGKGDFVFTDGKDSFLVVECKFLDMGDGQGPKQNKQKNKVKEQAKKYAKFVAECEQTTSVYYILYTNDSKYNIMNPIQYM
jgi:hypothetical protein